MRPLGRLLIRPRLQRAPGRAWAPAPQAHPSLHSEGSIIAYYWSEFSIPQYLVQEAEQAMAQEHVVTLPPRARAVSSFVLTSVVAFRECRGAGAGICLAWGIPGPVPSRGGCLLAGPSL